MSDVQLERGSQAVSDLTPELIRQIKDSGLEWLLTEDEAGDEVVEKNREALEFSETKEELQSKVESLLNVYKSVLHKAKRTQEALFDDTTADEEEVDRLMRRVNRLGVLVAVYESMLSHLTTLDLQAGDFAQIKSIVDNAHRVLSKQSNRDRRAA